jgi:hypothetical protein
MVRGRDALPETLTETTVSEDGFVRGSICNADADEVCTWKDRLLEFWSVGTDSNTGVPARKVRV